MDCKRPLSSEAFLEARGTSEQLGDCTYTSNMSLVTVTVDSHTPSRSRVVLTSWVILFGYKQVLDRI